MENTTPKKSGCSTGIILIIIGALLVLAIPVVVFIMFFMTTTSLRENEHKQSLVTYATIAERNGHDGSNEVIITRGSEPRGIKEGETEISRETYIAYAIDSNATTLSRQAFVKNANGKKVRWLLRVFDIQADSSRNDTISGNFDLPYKIVDHNSSMGSAVSLKAYFPISEEKSLSHLRRNDWATIEGKIEIDSDNSVIIHEAKLVK